MHRGTSRILLPVLLGGLTSVLFGLLMVMPRAGSVQARGSAEPTQGRLLPWEPLLRAPSDFGDMQSALAGVTRANLRDRLTALQSIHQDASRPETQRGLAAFSAAVLLSENGRGAEAIDLFRAPAIAATELEGYALYLAALELATKRPDEALALLRRVESEHGDIAVLDEVRLVLARLLRQSGDREASGAALRVVAKSDDPRLIGEALDALGSLLYEEKKYPEAALVLETLYYEHPRHPRASGAGRQLNLVRAKLPPVDPLRLFTLGLHRAELLMAEERYADASEALSSLIARGSRTAAVADEELVRLKLGVAQYHRRQLAAASATLKKIHREDLAPEALFYLAETARRLRQKTVWLTRAAELCEKYPKSPWSEEILFSLARRLDDDDERPSALGYYRRMLAEFPTGKHVLDARWRVLWEDFRAGRYADAAFGWEETARERPGSEESSKFLYWAGRSYQEAGRFDRAEPLYRQVLLGYQNTYYGRRALEHLSEIHDQRSSLAAIEAARSGIDLSEALSVERVDLQTRIAQLYVAGLEKEALRELARAVRGKRDDSAFLAMTAWIHADRRRNLDAFRTIREAFPFHVSATGDLLPRPIWELFYPLGYWEPIERYSVERGLDPYLVAALIRQESTFNPRVRSHAGARGLMQILPSTGKLLARQERLRYDVSDLYDPEINIRYGTRYLKDVLGSFGGRVDYALASYNAGPHRVRRWTGMDLTIPPEVFIEEIPFDETRNYVKLVLRNEMLYRRLYGGAEATAPAE
ncbi:MAG TPA: transglycosylase SLT domain-containing protein [Vicinamibacteria bacterium]|nr:transglycosylase SLT domain-containing protein [Vicinamibacteria bacterium]